MGLQIQRVQDRQLILGGLGAVQVRQGVGGGYTKKVLGYSPLAYWPLSDAIGLVATCLTNAAYNGTYANVTLGQPGIGDGLTCPYFPGTGCWISLPWALRSAFNGQEGSIHVWVKAAAGMWTDGQANTIIHFRVNVDNRLYIDNPINLQLSCHYYAGGVAKHQGDSSFSNYSWFPIGMSWSKTADELRFYYSGSQYGATGTGLGTWSGTPEASLTAIGAINTSGTADWKGWLAHVALWDRPLDPADFAALASI